MDDQEQDIAYCHACGAAMNVSAVGPFTEVECPSCSMHTRVKREFGPYTLLRRHAVGGMSVVFAAQDKTLDREVVVKILNEDFSADEKRIAAFEEEARVTASFSHPNVVRVLTTGRAFGRFYIAMDFLPGGHFEHHIRERGSIPEAEALTYAIGVVEGLNAANEAGLIHRDVKPGNIMFDGRGGVKLVDFGLALVTQGGKATASEIWATPYYVPPEAIDGSEEDFRSDMYGFGASFYHALAGKPPCGEDTMDTVRLKEAKRKVAPLRKVAPWVSEPTAAVIDRCMAYDPDRRFAKYADLLAALRLAEKLLASGGEGDSADENGTLQSAGRRGKRSRQTVWAGALLGLVGIGVVWWMAGSKDDPRVPVAEVGGTGGGEGGNPIPAGGQDGGDATGEEAMRVAALYRDARGAIAEQNFETAVRIFGEVRDAKAVLEPTGSLAGCEAVVAAYAAGRPEMAREQAISALEHVEHAKGLNESLGQRLIAALRDVGRIEVELPPDELKGGGVECLLWLIAGLKCWEHGFADRAEGYFKAVAAAPDQGGILDGYGDLAEAYLGDLELLRSVKPVGFELSEQECQLAIDQLDGVLGQLKTQGRARFDVRSWQMSLERRIRTLRQSGVEDGGRDPVADADGDAPPSAERSFPEGVWEDFAAARFQSAISRLKNWRPDDWKSKQRQKNLVILAEAAASFLADLGERKVALAGRTELRCRDGRMFVGIAGADPGQVRLVDSEGTEVSLPWGDLDAASLIAFHRQLIKHETNEFEVLRRHEQAVAYDFLAGDRERAVAAAGRLAETSKAFKKRWEPILAMANEAP